MTITQDVSQGEVIFRQGNFSDSAYIIKAGSFKVTRETVDGKPEDIGTLEKNDIFGEMGIIDGLPRCATVTALEDGRVTVLSRDDFEDLARRQPMALIPIMKVLSLRLRKAIK